MLGFRVGMLFGPLLVSSLSYVVAAACSPSSLARPCFSPASLTALLLPTAIAIESPETKSQPIFLLSLYDTVLDSARVFEVWVLRLHRSSEEDEWGGKVRVWVEGCHTTDESPAHHRNCCRRRSLLSLRAKLGFGSIGVFGLWVSSMREIESGEGVWDWGTEKSHPPFCLLNFLFIFLV